MNHIIDLQSPSQSNFIDLIYILYQKQGQYLDYNEIKQYSQKLEKRNQDYNIDGQINPQITENSTILCAGVIFVLLRLACVCSFYLTFGILFNIYTNNPQYNNQCQNKSFLDWSQAANIICFSISAILVLTDIYTMIQKRESFVYFGLLCAYYVFNFASFIVVIGLSVKDDSSCGYLHVLAMIYYIFYYSIIGFALLCCCCSLMGKIIC